MKLEPNQVCIDAVNLPLSPSSYWPGPVGGAVPGLVAHVLETIALEINISTIWHLQLTSD